MSRSTEREKPPEGCWRADLLTDGYCLFPGLAPSSLVAAAEKGIQDDLARSFDSARQLEYEHRSYCPELRESPVIHALLRNEAVRTRIDAAIEHDKLVVGPPQIAVRPARGAADSMPPSPHIDGVSTPHNGVARDALQTFTLLVGVFLTETAREFCGNLTVWPGSHLLLERHFRERGPRAMHEGQPPVHLGVPRQILSAPGDVVLCHYCLAHCAAVNTSDDDRVVVYFRLSLSDLAEQRWRRLTHIWDGWRIGGDAARG